MTRYSFQIVDVFGTGAFSGNPLAVVTTPEELDPDTMLRITRWLNFSETTFLLPPTDTAADYRVRIFTPARELPFAGHPTLGTCHAWLAAGGTPRDANEVVQQCGAGLVRVRRAGSALAFAAPPTIRSGAVEEDKLDEIAAVLRISRDAILASRWVDNGPGWSPCGWHRRKRCWRSIPCAGTGRRSTSAWSGPIPRVIPPLTRSAPSSAIRSAA
jgi:PhzF family phenazine biosynthesis protein